MTWEQHQTYLEKKVQRIPATRTVSAFSNTPEGEKVIKRWCEEDEVGIELPLPALKDPYVYIEPTTEETRMCAFLRQVTV